MTTAANQIARQLPTTKGERVDLALNLIKHATKADKRAWNKTRLTKADEIILDGLLVEWALRARKGKVIHLGALAGSAPACMADRDTLPAPADLLTTPFAVNGTDVTCKGCREVAGILTPEEEAAFKAAEDAAISREARRASKGPKAAKATRGRPNASGAINDARFNAVAQDGAIRLTGTYKGHTFAASLAVTGEVTISVEGANETLPSLSRAACYVRATKTCNGWRFWTIVANGEKADWLRGSDDDAAVAVA